VVHLLLKNKSKCQYLQGSQEEQELKKEEEEEEEELKEEDEKEENNTVCFSFSLEFGVLRFTFC
jgi:hypothetical protein